MRIFVVIEYNKLYIKWMLSPQKRRIENIYEDEDVQWEKGVDQQIRTQLCSTLNGPGPHIAIAQRSIVHSLSFSLFIIFPIFRALDGDLCVRYTYT